MKTIKTICIQIGNSDDKLTQREWHDFVECVDNQIRSIPSTIHFFGGPSNYTEWQNACWVISLKYGYIGFLKEQLKNIRKQYLQDSVAISIGKTEFI